jgi:hypothetical protein
VGFKDDDDSLSNNDKHLDSSSSRHGNNASTSNNKPISSIGGPDGKDNSKIRIPLDRSYSLESSSVQRSVSLD